MPGSRDDVARERRPFAFWVLAAIVVPLTSLFAKMRIEGAENLPPNGAYVLAPNHYSEFDALVVAVAVWRLGRPPRFMAKESLFRVPVLGWALKATGMVPVSRSSSAASARHTLRVSEGLVAQGRGVVVYPEGSLTRDPDMWPMRGKTGAARLALADDIPVLPMVHWGVQAIMPRYGKLRFWPLRRPVTVVVGPPVDLDDLRATRTSPASLSTATTRIMDALTQLLAGIRGVTAPAERWDPTTHGQRETGRLEP